MDFLNSAVKTPEHNLDFYRDVRIYWCGIFDEEQNAIEKDCDLKIDKNRRITRIIIIIFMILEGIILITEQADSFVIDIAYLMLFTVILIIVGVYCISGAYINKIYDMVSDQKRDLIRCHTTYDDQLSAVMKLYEQIQAGCKVQKIYIEEKRPDIQVTVQGEDRQGEFKIPRTYFDSVTNTLMLDKIDQVIDNMRIIAQDMRYAAKFTSFLWRSNLDFTYNRTAKIYTKSAGR